MPCLWLTSAEASWYVCAPGYNNNNSNYNLSIRNIDILLIPVGITNCCGPKLDDFFLTFK